MDSKQQVLQAIKAFGEPVNAGKVVELTGLDRKVVDKAMNDLARSCPPSAATGSPPRTPLTP